MTRIVLPALALACVCSPALAAEASEPVTWGAVYAVLGWIGLGVGVLFALIVALAIIFVAIGGFNDWSH